MIYLSRNITAQLEKLSIENLTLSSILYSIPTIQANQRSRVKILDFSIVNLVVANTKSKDMQILNIDNSADVKIEGLSLYNYNMSGPNTQLFLTR
jgi:hypothetical protein